MGDGGRAPLDAENLLDGLDATLREVGGDAFPVVPVLRPGEAHDAAVVIRDDAPVEAGARALAADAGVARVQRSDRRFLVRFEDERIAALGAALEAGAGAGLATADLRARARCIVDFCDPNATKALHAGHLRNIALGQALSSMLEASGAHVVRQTHIGDAGRSMGEAMAGYLRYGDGATPADRGVKSDHFVGDLYARYVIDHAPIEAANAEDAPVARDLEERDDLAQQLLSRCEEGDPEALALWRTVRDWAVAGQDETLARLGLRFDRVLFDSDRGPDIEAVVELALAREAIVREPSGALVYETGDDSYPKLPLSRTDGFPTHNLRVVAMWHALMRREPDADLIHLSGDEWRSHTVHVEELLRTIEPDLRVFPTTHVLHGMVVTERGKVSSSKGGALLIDDLFEELLAHDEVGALALPDRPGATADELVSIALLGFCLDRQIVKRVVLAPEKLLDPEANTGWRIAQAWAKACHPDNDGPADPAPADPAYRFVVLQSQLHRRLLVRALEQLDVLKFVRFLAHLSEWYLAAPHDPRVGRVVRATLLRAMGAMGLLRRGAAAWADADGVGSRAAVA